MTGPKRTRRHSTFTRAQIGYRPIEAGTRLARTWEATDRCRESRDRRPPGIDRDRWSATAARRRALPVPRDRGGRASDGIRKVISPTTARPLTTIAPVAKTDRAAPAYGREQDYIVGHGSRPQQRTEFEPAHGRENRARRRACKDGGSSSSRPRLPGVTSVLSRIGDKWSVLVIVMLADGPRRFNELKRMIDGVSQRMLTLRALERDGHVTRYDISDHPAARRLRTDRAAARSDQADEGVGGMGSGAPAGDRESAKEVRCDPQSPMSGRLALTKAMFCVSRYR